MKLYRSAFPVFLGQSIDRSFPSTYVPLRSQPLIFALGCARPSLATESNGNARQPVSEALCSLPQLANGHASARLVAKESSTDSKFVHVARAPISRSPVRAAHAFE